MLCSNSEQPLTVLYCPDSPISPGANFPVTSLLNLGAIRFFMSLNHPESGKDGGGLEGGVGKRGRSGRGASESKVHYLDKEKERQHNPSTNLVRSQG